MNLDHNFNNSKRPKSSAFHQQTLKGWKPIITTNNLYLSFFGIGIIFIIVGSLLIYQAYQINEITINYTDCKNSDGIKCSDMLSKFNYTHSYKHCECVVNITIPQAFRDSVYVYYGLNNFFQNHRRYVKSRDDRQLKGLYVETPDANCEPYRFSNLSSLTTYAPCGIVANSLFNDTFQLNYVDNYTITPVPWDKKGIAWQSETSVRYGQPKSWLNTAKPPNWPIPEQNRSSSAYSGDEELIVWMRTAALPNFKKLHRIIQHTSEPFREGLPKGSYFLKINYSYPVTHFRGTKTFILSTTNYLGGKNTTLGIVYLLVGTIYFSIAIAFVFINQFVSRRQLNEAWYIASQGGANGCPNETFCHVESDNSNNGYIEQGSGISVCNNV